MKQTLFRIGGSFCRLALICTALMCIGWADTWQALKSEAGAVTSVKAEFVQEKNLKILARPLVSNGRMVFKAPDSLRWEYSRPVKSTLVLYNGKARRFIQKDGHLLEDASAGLQAMQVVVQQITLWLSGRFDESRAFAASLEPGPKIVMTPKEDAVEKLIQRIDIVLSDRPAVIKSVTIYESEDSFTRLIFQNVLLNTNLADAEFQIVK